MDNMIAVIGGSVCAQRVYRLANCGTTKVMRKVIITISTTTSSAG